MGRITWGEKAKRLAIKHELYDAGDPQSSDVENMLTCRNGIRAFGIVDEEGRKLWWKIKNNEIEVEVLLR